MLTPKMAEPLDPAILEILQSVRLDMHETSRPFLLCLKCPCVFAVEPERTIMAEVLTGSPPKCERCGTPINAWEQAYYSAAKLDRGVAPNAIFGLRNTVVMYPLSAGSVMQLDLRERGVPSNVQILRVVHGGRGDGVVTSIESADSTEPLGFTYRVLGSWVGNGEPPKDFQGSTTVLWAPHDADDIGRSQLVAALAALTNNRLRAAIVPASVAVELPMGRLMEAFFKAHGVAGRHRKPFLKDHATFGQQLNVLLPVASSVAGVAQLDSKLVESLNTLRGLRNDVAHSGGTKPLTRDLVIEERERHPEAKSPL
jgi:hypothetical protein